MKNYGVKIKYFHPLKDINKFEKLITNSKTKLIYLESPGTATFEILDIPKITKIAKKKKFQLLWIILGHPLFFVTL